MQFDRLKRRNVFTLIGGAAAWPLAAPAQQAAKPVVGYLVPGTSGQNAHLLVLIRQILAEAGYVEGLNLTIEYRFAEGQYDNLPALAAELVQRQPAVIIAGTTPAALAARAATATIPIVFNTPDDPVGVGLVASLARPGGNATGVHQFNTALGAKQIGLLRELVPSATRVGLLVNPNNSNAAGTMSTEVTAAAATIGVEIGVVRATASWRAAAKAPAVGKRSSGRFAMALRITHSTSGPTSGLIERGGGGEAVTCMRPVAMGVVDRKGTVPVTR